QAAEVVERDGDLMVDVKTYDAPSGRVVTRRTIVRGGQVRRMEFSVRPFTLRELAGWLEEAGFGEVRAYGAEGEPFGLLSRRMIAVGQVAGATAARPTPRWPAAGPGG